MDIHRSTSDILAGSEEGACGAGATAEPLSVAEAIDGALRVCKTVSETEFLPIPQAIGRVLSNAVFAEVDLPMFDNSAMDGFAVSLSTFVGEGPWLIPIVGRIAAGQEAVFEEVGALRIFTGAWVPPSFDAVIKQEQCEVLGVDVLVRSRPAPGDNIRRQGENLRTGDIIARQGDQLSPTKLGLLAAQGIESVKVFRRVRVGLIETGDELRVPGMICGKRQIHSSNGLMLTATMSAYPWIDVLEFGIVPDDVAALVVALSRAEQTSDVILTTGGVSGGEEDHVCISFRGIGGDVTVQRVAMRPGKPLKVGMTNKIFFAGLPGNPSATLAGFLQIVFPALRKIAGINEHREQAQAAIADFSYLKNANRTDFLLARVVIVNDDGVPIVSTSAKPNSSDLVGMSEADGYVVALPDTTHIEPGAFVRFERFSWSRC